MSMFSMTSPSATPRSLAVPPVETISTPRSARPRAKSTRPRLSETVSSARLTRTSPGAVGSIRVGSAARAILDRHEPGIVGVDVEGARRDQADRPRQQPVLDRVHVLLDLIDVPRIRKLERLLQDDRPAVHPFVDEVDGHTDHLDTVLERPSQRVQSGKRRQQRGMHVDYPPLEAADERPAQDLHEPREDHQVHAPLREPVAEHTVAFVAIGVAGDREGRGLDPGPPRALQCPGVRPAGCHPDDLDPLPTVNRVEDGLEVRALAGDENGDAERHYAAAGAGPRSTGEGPPLVSIRPSAMSASI